MDERWNCRIAWLVLVGLVAVREAAAQAPTVAPAPTAEPGSMQSTLGPTPGAGLSPFGTAPGTDAGILTGRAGPTVPRVPTAITMPGAANLPGPPQPRIGVTDRLSIANVPIYGPLAVPEHPTPEGPADGLSLDRAIDLLLRENLVLRARIFPIEKARADVITAGLRANPILYTDGQLVPYGQYSKHRPGGPNQYDLNVTHPVDVTGKRLARAATASQVVTVLEAQYQDAIRLEIDNLYTAYVDALAARETIRFAEASVEGLKRVLEINETLFRKANLTQADVSRIRALLEAAVIGREQASEYLGRAKRNLGMLLNLLPEQAERLELLGTIADVGSPPPALPELIATALQARPDLNAARLAIGRAEASVIQARAERYGDVYVLYQPYTFQNNAPTGQKSATSWALGVTAPVPIYNRNQGAILRARFNVQQTAAEFAARERQVRTEVALAEREYQVTRAAVQRYEHEAIPSARKLRDDSLVLFVAGEQTALSNYNAQRDYNEIVRLYREMLVRHRRSMLRLNTAVGQRILP